MSIHSAAGVYDATDTLATTAVVPWGMRGGSVQSNATNLGSTAVYGCHTEDGTFGILYDTNAVAITVVFDAANQVRELPSAVFGVPFLKFVVTTDGEISVAGAT
jgi:hypothetical protein